MAGKGLGAGLGALFGDAALEDKESLGTYVPLSKIEPRQDQPRSVFDDEKLAELAESIGEHGIIQPLTVRRLDKGYYQIIAGERRWRAARLAGLAEAPVIIIEADDKTAMEMAMVENLQREDLNPVEEARGYKVLVSEYGMTQEEAAKRVGKSRPVVANSLRLLALPDAVLALMEKGELSVSHARLILELDKPGDRVRAAELIVEKKLTVREAETLIKRMKAVGEQEKPSKKPGGEIDYVAEVEKDLTKSLGRKVKIVYGRRKGRIELEYYGNDDFEAICEALQNLGKGER